MHCPFLVRVPCKEANCGGVGKIEAYSLSNAFQLDAPLVISVHPGLAGSLSDNIGFRQWSFVYASNIRYFQNILRVCSGDILRVVFTSLSHTNVGSKGLLEV